jgi:hypothetical protein
MIQEVKICPVCSRELSEEHRICPSDGIALVNLDTGADERGESLVGQVVGGRYRLERVVGRGGMGTVYSCRHVVVGKAFAIKVLRSGVERSSEVLQRFIREAQAANAVRSRHICEMVDFGQLESGAFYVVMDLLEGVSLTRALRDRQLDQAELRRVFMQIADTLERAHRAGIVHRDLKPDNVILVDDEGDPHFVKLVDFGIAKMMQADASHLTETGIILGTPYYMSPEQARGDAVDARSDIYALGVMMYRAFTGKLPFVADTAMGVLTRHLIEAPVLPSRVAEIDPVIERVILRCMEKQAIDRFQSMADVAEALKQVGAAGPQLHGQTTVDERSGAALRAALNDRLGQEGLVTGAQAAGRSPPMPPAPAPGDPYAAQTPWSAAMPALPGPPFGGHPATTGAGPAALDPRASSGPYAPASWPGAASQALPLVGVGGAITGPHLLSAQPAGTRPPLPLGQPGPGATGPHLPPMQHYGPRFGQEGMPRDLAVEAFTNRGLVANRYPRTGGAKGPRIAFLAFGAVVMLSLGTLAALVAFRGNRTDPTSRAPAGASELPGPAQSVEERATQPAAEGTATAAEQPDASPDPTGPPTASTAASGSASGGTVRVPPPSTTHNPEIRSPFD